MAILMDGMERERACVSYLESLGVLDSESLCLAGHKYILRVDDEDSFYQIAEATGVDRIINYDGDGLDFEIQIPSKPRNDTWFVFLSYCKSDAFLNKYNIGGTQ